MALKKIAVAEDIATQIVLLSSAKASGHVSGQVVTIAGGMEGELACFLLSFILFLPVPLHPFPSPRRLFPFDALCLNSLTMHALNADHARAER